MRWSLHQLFLIFFRPTLVTSEVEGHGAQLSTLERFRYMVRMLPWSIGLFLAGGLTIQLIFTALGIPADSKYHFYEIAVINTVRGLTIGIGFSLALGMLLGVARGAAFGAMFGLAFGVLVGLFELSPSLRPTLSLYGYGTTFGLALAAAFGRMERSVSRVSDMAGSILAGLAAILLQFLIFSASNIFGGNSSILDSLKQALPVTILFATSAVLTFGWILFLMYLRVAYYPLEVLLTITSFVIARMRPRSAWQAWQWCPVAWNEAISFPLPFVSNLLVLLVRQNRKEGLETITLVAAEGRVSRRTARAALVEVAIYDLRITSLTELSDVMDRLNWAMDAPADLPEVLTTVLPRFDRTAQHVAQYLVLHSPFRKGEALGRAIAETGALERSLIATRGRYATRLLHTAEEWRKLIDVEDTKAKAQAVSPREIPNPFVFGNAVIETEHNVFTGRRDTVDHIENSVLGTIQTPTLLLHGPRRMGKTSILNQLPRLLGRDFVPTVVDCQNPTATSSPSSLLRYIARKLSEGLRRRRLEVGPLSVVALEHEPFAVFDEWLETLERTLPGGTRALLCLDEYERLQAALDQGWGGSFLDLLRHTLQHRKHIVLMFTGAHTFQELGPAWTDRFISARRVRISFLSREEVEPLLTQPIPGFDMTYAPGALDAIIAATNGQPFLVQATAFELVELLNGCKRKEATSEDVELAIGRALESGGEYFANVWSDAGGEGQSILRAIVRGEAPPDLPGARAWLREQDVLSSAGDFAVEMVRRWVKARFS